MWGPCGVLQVDWVGPTWPMLDQVCRLLSPCCFGTSDIIFSPLSSQVIWQWSALSMGNSIKFPWQPAWNEELVHRLHHCLRCHLHPLCLSSLLSSVTRHLRTVSVIFIIIRVWCLRQLAASVICFRWLHRCLCPLCSSSLSLSESVVSVHYLHRHHHLFPLSTSIVCVSHLCVSSTSIFEWGDIICCWNELWDVCLASGLMLSLQHIPQPIMLQLGKKSNEIVPILNLFSHPVRSVWKWSETGLKLVYGLKLV